MKYISNSNDPSSQNEGDSQGSQGRRPRNAILSREEILAKINSLIGTIAVGLISTPQASVMLRALLAQLNDTYRNQKDGAGSASLEKLAALYRQKPEMLDAIQFLLTDEQIDMLTKLAANPEK